MAAAEAELAQAIEDDETTKQRTAADVALRAQKAKADAELEGQRAKEKAEFNVYRTR